MNSEVKINDSLGREEPWVFTPLPAEPITVTEQTWPKDTIPLVSICCITYNHESFIQDAIDGFLMQKTSFPIEILIYDDASTDETANIIKVYEDKHPYIIKPIYQTENQYSKGVRPTAKFNLPRAKGKYIALCEGDDYWTDPLKLKKQVDLLEANPDFSSYFHNTTCVYENGSQECVNYVAPTHKLFFTLYDLSIEGNFIPTCSIMFRRELLGQLPDWWNTLYARDWGLHILNSQYGNIGYIDEFMGVYRNHSGGLWSGISYINQLEATINDCKILRANVDAINKRAITSFLNENYLQLALYHKDNGDLSKSRTCVLNSIGEAISNACIPTRKMLRILIMTFPKLHKSLNIPKL